MDEFALQSHKKAAAAVKSGFFDNEILDVEIDHGRGEGSGNPSAVFSLRLPRHQPHSDVLVSVSGLDCVYTVEEF